MNILIGGSLVIGVFVFLFFLTRKMMICAATEMLEEEQASKVPPEPIHYPLEPPEYDRP